MASGLAWAALAAAVFLWSNPFVGYADITYRMIAESIDGGSGFRVWEVPEFSDWIGNYMTPAGYLSLHHTIGRSLLALPAYALFRLALSAGGALGLPAPAFGPGTPLYRAAFNLPGLLAALLALAVLFRTARRLAGALPALAGTALAVASSYFFLLLVVHHSWADGPLMLALALLVREAAAVDRGGSRGAGVWFALGLFSGLAAFFRLQAIVSLGIPAASWIILALREKGRGAPFRLLMVIAGFALGVAPAILYQHYYVGAWNLTYTFGSTGQSWGEILQVVRHLSPRLLESPVFITGVLLSVLLIRRSPGVALGGGFMLLGSFLEMALYRGWENQCWAGGRFPMLLLPFSVLGLSLAISRLPMPIGMGVFIAGMGVNLLGPLSRYLGECSEIFKGSAPFFQWGERVLANEAPRAFIPPAELLRRLPLLARDGAYLLFHPKFAGAPAAAAVAAASVACLAAAALAGRRFRRFPPPGRLPAAAAAAFAVYSLLVIAAVGESGKRWIAEREREGFYRSRWRTVVFDLWDESGLAHGRSITFRKLGNFAAARRQFPLTFLNWSGSTARVAYRELSRFQEERGFAGHLFVEMPRASGALAPAGGSPAEPFDGSLETSARLGPGSAEAVSFRFDPLLCSDIYVVCGSPSAAAAARVELAGEGGREEVPRDDWPDRPGDDSRPWAMQFGDTLWVRDVFRREYRRGWIAFPGRGGEVREIFAVMSPRHFTAAPGSCGDPRKGL